MQNRDKPLVWVVIALLFSASLLLCLGASAQSLTMPAHLSRNPEYWWNEYETEHARAEGLAQSGATAISGLKASLGQANETIRKQTGIITVLTADRNSATDRAVKAETALAKCEGDKPKTWVGRKLQKVGNGLKTGLAVVGAIALPILFIR